MRIVAVGNQKGGVGKTTTAYTLAHIAAQGGMRVLIVDVDAQGSMTTLCCDPRSERRTSLANAMGGVDPAMGLCEVTRKVAQNIDVAPGGAPLLKSETWLHSCRRRETFLQRILKQVRDEYDLVIIDTPPAVSLMTDNALVAAHEVIIPTQAHALDIQGLSDFCRTVQEVQEINPDLRISGVVLTFFNDRLREHRQAREKIAKANLPLCTTTIGQSVRVAEASRHQQPVTTFAHDNRQAHAYKKLADELRMRGSNA